MMSGTVPIRTPRSAPMQGFFRAHPEWWALALAAIAWVIMVVPRHPAHNHAEPGLHGVPQQVGAWLAMVVAMMLPTVSAQVSTVARGSLWRRRHRAIAGFLLGFLLPWCGLGVAAAPLLAMRPMNSVALPAILFAVTALWQRTETYRFARSACHRTMPLAPTGWMADRDCCRYGAAVGVASMQGCWALMLACAATGHDRVAMSGGLLIGLVEMRGLQPASRTSLCGTLGLALYYALPLFGWQTAMHM